jgi:exonuclease SbcD
MSTVRFIHTSDIHLDTSFSGSGFPSRLGDRKREAIRATFRRIIADARLYKVDFVLIAGDLYESDRVTPDTVEFLKQQFENLEGSGIFISPGNHDPYMQGSPYKEEAWPKNVHIFDREEFQSIDLPNLGVRVSGFGFVHALLEDHPFQLLNVLPKEAFNVVLSHGSDLSRVPAGKSRGRT